VKFFSNIKLRIGNYVINKNRKNLRRFKKVHNLKSAKYIGILFDATDKKHFDYVQDFYKFLRLRGIEVMVLGFVNSKDVPDKYLFKKDFCFFLRKSLNWYKKPVNDDVEKFIHEKFDILIDLNVENHFAFKYIFALSPAQFKVGRVTAEPNYYDLMINIQKRKEVDYFIEQTTHYLEIINRPELSPGII
jgi:hypothetical protein